MALKYENVIREELLLNGEILTIVWDEEAQFFRIAKYYKENNSFSKGEPYKDRKEADAAFLNLVRKVNDNFKLDGNETFDTFFCESLPEWGRSVGLCNSHTFDCKMTLDEADEYIKNHEVLNPDNNKPYIRVRFPMLWSEEMGKYVYYEAALEEE